MHKKIMALILTGIFVAVIAVGCNSSSTSVKNYLGNWQDISDSTRTAKIYADTKAGYIWEDNEGKYTAKFENGVLKVQATDIGTAVVTYDDSSKHLKIVLTDEKTKEVQKTEFKKE